MKLSDVVSAAGLAAYAEIALIIFFLVFAIIAVFVLFSRRQTWEHAAHMPLNDEPLPAPRKGEE